MTRDPSSTRTEVLSAAAFSAAIPDLATLLVDAVAGGASVNFLAGLADAEAAAWWAGRAAEIQDGTTTVVVARRPDGRIVGCASLMRARQQNAPHRAEVGKVLVHSDARRQGLGRALMGAVEALAARDGRWLLILDTQAGSPAETLYRTLGWQELGVMPDHALGTDGIPAPTTYFWKDLRATDVSR